jgi:mannosyl-3-phosphoglycerate phosphatase
MWLEPARSVHDELGGKLPVPVVVFADIDESFLTPKPLSMTGGAEDILATERVGLTLCSNMTRAEIEMIQQELGIRQPFICESGAAALIPDGYFPFEVSCDRRLPGYHVVDFGRPYAEVVDLLHRTADRLEIAVAGFSDQSIEDVARGSGLSLSHARLAKLREYDEPFELVNPSPDARHRLWRALRAAGLCCTAQGVYEHVGAPVSKGYGVSLLTRLYRQAFSTCLTVGLGSGPNSSGLLHNVNIPFMTETCVANVNARPKTKTRFPRIALTMNRSGWLDTTLELARCARQHKPRRTWAMQ